MRIIFILILVSNICYGQITTTINCSDPCENISYPDEKKQGVFDCHISNIRVDTSRTFICLEGVKTLDVEETNEVIIPTGCFESPQIKVVANTNTGTVGWNDGYYTSNPNCPFNGDFEACVSLSYEEASKLFIFNLSSTPNSFWGEYSIYSYDLDNGNTDRDWIRPYQLGGGGYVTGWLDYSNINDIDVCIERTGNTITYKANGVTFYTGSAFYMGAVYINYTAYFHPSNIWSTGTHSVSSKICETNGGLNSRIGRTISNRVFIDPLEEFETLPELWGYQSGQFSWNDLNKEMKRLGINLSKKEVEEILKKYEVELIPELGITLEKNILDRLTKPNAISTISGKFSERELIIFAVNKGVVEKISDWDGKLKRDLIIKLLQWAKEKRLISIDQYRKEIKQK